jgi:Transposase DDE domain/Domain of unknown function (DUF4372)
MKKTKPSQRCSKGEVLRQICNFIPPFLVSRLAQQYGVDKLARTFTPWSHVVAMLYAQLTHVISLNDLCDALHLFSGPLSAIRGAVAPSRNALSNANRKRDAKMAEALLWQSLTHLQTQSPGFGAGRRRLPRFKRTLHAVDATVITLVANCMSWAQHRRRKAATKLHLNLDLQSQLPRFAILDLQPRHENTRAPELCAGLRRGEIAIFDKAYGGLAHLAQLTQRGVFWVTRAKDNMNFRVVKKQLRRPEGRVLRDDVVQFCVPRSNRLYPEKLRRVVVLVELDGAWVEMEFLTNNFDWAPSTIAELYRCRWDIEKFFRQIKQTLHLCDFLGNSGNAVHWQIWTALLVYVLLCYLKFLSGWNGHFTRLWALVRTSLWRKWEVVELLELCGTAPRPPRIIGQPEQAYLALG